MLKEAGPLLSVQGLRGHQRRNFGSVYEDTVAEHFISSAHQKLCLSFYSHSILQFRCTNHPMHSLGIAEWRNACMYAHAHTCMHTDSYIRCCLRKLEVYVYSITKAKVPRSISIQGSLRIICRIIVNPIPRDP